MNNLQQLRRVITITAAGAFAYAGCGGEAEQNLAECLVEKNVRLYTAHWCAPCHEQERKLEEQLGESWNYFEIMSSSNAMVNLK